MRNNLLSATYAQRIEQNLIRFDFQNDESTNDKMDKPKQDDPVVDLFPDEDNDDRTSN